MVVLKRDNEIGVFDPEIFEKMRKAEEDGEKIKSPIFYRPLPDRLRQSVERRAHHARLRKYLQPPEVEEPEF